MQLINCKDVEQILVEKQLLVHLLKNNRSETFGIIHLVRTQNFPKNQHFLPPDAHTYVSKKCWFFGKFCVRTKWMTPFQNQENTCFAIFI